MRAEPPLAMQLSRQYVPLTICASWDSRKQLTRRRGTCGGDGEYRRLPVPDELPDHDSGLRDTPVLD
jgi:hypothetical protein